MFYSKEMKCYIKECDLNAKMYVPGTCLVVLLSIIYKSVCFRFSVKWEILRQDTRQDMSTDIKGMSFIDVPANGTKDYKLNVFAYKETTLPLKVKS